MLIRFVELIGYVFLKEICNLKKLTQLDLSENKIEKLPDDLGAMTSLSDLLLSQNQLEYLPDSIGIFNADQGRVKWSDVLI